MQIKKNEPRFWIGVASHEHVVNGQKLGICQFCHGKQAPAKRLKKGDFIIYYSPRTLMHGGETCQSFTALGRVVDEAPYQVAISADFQPFRRNVSYFDTRSVPIRDILSQLVFIRKKESWGVVFRYGFFSIDAGSFDVIARAMLGYNPAENSL